MTRPGRVLRSINNEDASRCVDLFVRPDGSVGFEEYRREAEDPRGWFAVGHHAAIVFAELDQALSAARRAIPWLEPWIRNETIETTLKK